MKKVLKKIEPISLYNDGIGFVEYVDHMGSDLTIVNAARVSRSNENKKKELDEKDEKLIRFLIKNKHTSPFEHNIITFRFCVPLFIRSQHHRHRTWSFNEISRRYTDVDIKFYEPELFRTQHKKNRQASNMDDLINPYMNQGRRTLLPIKSNTASQVVINHNLISLNLYKKLLENGVCREQARMVLPQSLYTKYYGTIDLHNLIKFISLRTASDSQWEIQQVGFACKSIANKLYPTTMKCFNELLQK